MNKDFSHFSMKKSPSFEVNSLSPPLIEAQRSTVFGRSFHYWTWLSLHNQWLDVANTSGIGEFRPLKDYVPLAKFRGAAKSPQFSRFNAPVGHLRSRITPSLLSETGCLGMEENPHFPHPLIHRVAIDSWELYIVVNVFIIIIIHWHYY